MTWKNVWCLFVDSVTVWAALSYQIRRHSHLRLFYWESKLHTRKKFWLLLVPFAEKHKESRNHTLSDGQTWTNPWISIAASVSFWEISINSVINPMRRNIGIDFWSRWLWCYYQWEHHQHLLLFRIFFIFSKAESPFPHQLFCIF